MLAHADRSDWVVMVEQDHRLGNEIEWTQCRVEVDGRWPWLQGHFPDKPIMPGVGLLWLVLQSIRRELADPDLQIVALNRIRFRELVEPGAVLDIFVEKSQAKRGQLVRFRICCEQKNVAEGRLELGPEVAK